GFGAITLVLVLLAAYSLHQISEMRAETDAIVVRDISIFRHMNDMTEATSRAGDARDDAVARYLTSALNRPARDTADPAATWRRRAAASEAAFAQAIAAVNQYRAQAVSPERAEAWRQIGLILGEAAALEQELRAASERQIGAIAANDMTAVLNAEQNVD